MALVRSELDSEDDDYDFVDDFNESKKTVEASKSPDKIVADLKSTPKNASPAELKTQPQAVVSVEIDPENLANDIYKKLQDTKQNGVACALNKLAPEARKKIIEHWKKSHPALAIYFSAGYEIVPEEYGLFYKSYDLLHSLKEDTLPAALRHAVKVKLKLISLSRLYAIRHPHGPNADEEYQFRGEIEELFLKSTLHLSFRGTRIITWLKEMCNLDFSYCDFTDFSFIMPNMFVHCNFSYADFTGAAQKALYVIHCKFTGAILEKCSSSINFEEYGLCDFRQAILSDTQKRMLKSSIIKFILDQPNASFDKQIKHCATPLLETHNCQSDEDYLTLSWLIGAVDFDDLIAKIKDVTSMTISPEFREFLDATLNRMQTNVSSYFEFASHKRYAAYQEQKRLAAIAAAESKQPESPKHKPELTPQSTTPPQAEVVQSVSLFGRLFCCRSRRHKSTLENLSNPIETRGLNCPTSKR